MHTCSAKVTAKESKKLYNIMVSEMGTMCCPPSLGVLRTPRCSDGPGMFLQSMPGALKTMNKNNSFARKKQGF